MDSDNGKSMASRDAAALFFARHGGGPVPFEEWMQAALYDPEHGYYTRHIHTVGPEGDFSTAATLRPGLGLALARWLSCGSEPRQPRQTIELGGGGGELTRAFHDALPFWRRWGFHHHIVEISKSLRERQQVKLNSTAFRWHERIEEAMEATGGSAVVWANEFFDSFPVVILQWACGGWRELLLRWNDSEVVEVLAEERSPRAQEALEEALKAGLPTTPREGQRIEVALAARDWLRRAGAGHCEFLVVDYGEEAETLWRQRPYGTLRAYFRHLPLVGEEVYRRFGRQDITCDVNFTLLAQWMREAGWRVGPAVNQRAWMEGVLGRELPADMGQGSDTHFLVLIGKPGCCGHGAVRQCSGPE